jgi:serine/threonine protein kinase
VRDVDPARLELGARLGGGGFALVYAGRLDGEEVAVKALFDPSATSKQVHEFLDEVESMASVASHPHVVRLLGAHTTPPQLCCVMERMSESVFSILYEPGPGSPKATTARRVRWCVGLAAALAHLHAQTPPLVHRDVKPHNVLVAAGAPDVAKLTDFGLCRNPNPLAGTPNYMAPELVQGRRFGPPADVWALGCFIAEVLGGVAPFAGLTVADITAALVAGRGPSVPRTVPDFLRPLCEQCLRVDPDQRPTAQQVHDTLAAFRPQTSRVKHATKAIGGKDALDDLMRK